MSYTSAPTIGGYGNINATNYGQYNAQGYDTSQYGYNTAPSMSLLQAAWIKGTSTGYRSPYAGMSNLQYMQAVDQRAKMFWHDAAVKGASALTYAGGYLYFNAGQAFMSVGKTLGKGVETASTAINVAPEIAWEGSGASLRIGKGLYAFGKSGEYGWAAQALWHKSLTPAFTRVANEFAKGGEWVGNMFGEGVTHIGNKLGWETAGQQIKGAGNAVGGWLKSAGSWGKTAEQVGKEGENLTGAARTAYRAGMYFADKGVIAGITKAGLRGAAFAAAPMAYFMATGAVLNFGINGLENVLSAGDEATQSAALTFQSLKGKIFNQNGRDASVKNAEDIAKAIRRQVITETGISGAASRFLFGHKLNSEIEKKTALFGAFADYGLIDKSSSGNEFVKKAQDLEKAVKSLSKTFQITTSQTLDMVRVMKSQGIGNGQLAVAGANTVMTANMSGYSNQQVMSIQSRGSEAFRGTYFGTEVGIGMANDVIQRTSIMATRDPEYNKAMYALRGKDSANVFLTQMQSRLANSSEVKKLLVASLFKKQNGRYVFTGRVNKEALAEEMSGAHTYLSDFNTQTELVQSYKMQLTSAERFRADTAIQRYSEHLSSGQMNSLIGSALRTAGYMTKEEGLAAQYVAQGIPPKVAAQLAKAMSKDISNDIVTATYKADALRKLNLDAMGDLRSTSILKAVGNNLDLGIASSLASFTGSISEKVFGKRGAGIGEVGMAAGVGIGLAVNPLAGLAIAGAAGAGAYGYNLKSPWAASTAVAHGAAAYGAYTALGGGLLGAASTIGATATGLVGGYMGSGLATSAARHYYGMTNRQLYARHRNVMLGARVGGATLGGAGFTAGSMYMLGAGAMLSNPVGMAILGVGTLAGAAYGTYKYITERDENDLLGKREDILGAARSARDMDLLRGTDLGNRLAASYTHKFTPLASMKKLTASYRSIFKREMSKLNAGKTSLTEFLNSPMASWSLSNSTKEEIYKYGYKTKIAESMKKRYGLTHHSDFIETLFAMFPQHNVSTLAQREVMRLMSETYRDATAERKAEIVEKLGGKWAIPYLEGKRQSKIVKIDELKKQVGKFNEQRHTDITLGQTSALAGALNSLGSLLKNSPEMYNDIRGNASDATIGALAKQYGLDSAFLYNFINNNYGTDVEKTLAQINADVGQLGSIGINASRNMLIETADKAIGKSISPERADAVQNAVNDIIRHGMSQRAGYALNKALGKTGGGAFSKSLRNAYRLSQDLLGMSMTMSHSLSLEDYKKMKNKGPLSQAMFSIAAGNDKILTSDELAQFSRQTMIDGIRRASVDALSLSPAQESKEIGDNIKRSTALLEIIAKNTDSTEDNDYKKVTDNVVNTLLKKGQQR